MEREINIDDIKKITLFNRGDEGNNTPEEVFIFFENEEPIHAKYNEEFEKVMCAFLDSNNIETTKEGIDVARSIGIFDVSFIDGEEYDKAKEEYDKEVEKYSSSQDNSPVNIPANSIVDDSDVENINVNPDDNDLDLDNDEQIVDEDDNIDDIDPYDLDDKKANKKKILKRVVAGTAAVGAVAGIALVLKSCDADEKSSESDLDYNSASFEELLNELKQRAGEDNERYIMFSKVGPVLEQLNNNAKSAKVTADGENILQFTSDEIIAANLVLNNYDSNQLFEMFGGSELNAEAILNNYENFASKLEIYYMNAQTPSGISNLIENEANREWFEQIETSIVNFNKNVNQENADKVIRTAGYLFTHQLNGASKLNTDEASISGVKNLALNILKGYQLANGEKDYSKYLKVASVPGEFDNKFVTTSSAQIQKGETLKFYLDEAEKGNCTIDTLKDRISTMVSDLKARQNIAIAEAQADINNNKDAEDTLNGKFDSTKYVIVEDIPTFEQMQNALDKKYTYVDVDIVSLINNRIRGLSKFDVNEKTAGTQITMDEWNKMSSNEQLEYAKKNGEVVSTKKSTTTTKVNKSDLSASEKKEAEKQEKSIAAEKEVIIDSNTYKGDKAAAAKEGWTDATNYAEEKNAYSYHTITNNVNPDAPSTVPTNGTLSDIAQAAYAFEGVTITSSDSQIQSRYSQDVAKFKKTTSDSTLVDAYKSGWLSGINQKLDSAVKQGKITRANAEKLYNEIKKATEEKNKTTNESTTEEKTQTTTEEKKNNSSSESTTKNNNYAEEKKNNDTGLYDPNLEGPVDSDLDTIYDENYSSDDTKLSVNSYYSQVLESAIYDDYSENIAEEKESSHSLVK